MPQMIQMRAVVAFERQGKHLKVGDLFFAFPLEAASLRYNRKAEFCTGDPATRQPAQTYGTRHMQAAPPGREEPPRTTTSAAPEQTADAEPQSPAEGRRGRRGQDYRTRHLRSSEG